MIYFILFVCFLYQMLKMSLTGYLKKTKTDPSFPKRVVYFTNF